MFTWLDVDEHTYQIDTARRALEAINDCAPVLINDITRLQALLTVTAKYLEDTSHDLHNTALQIKGDTGLSVIPSEDQQPSH